MAAAFSYFVFGVLSLLISFGHGLIFDGFNDAIHRVGDTLDHVAKKLEHVFDNVKLVENLLAEAIEEDCEFQCPNGAKPVENKNHVPSVNGCGSVGFQWQKDTLPLEELEECCNQHDICYDTCNKKKEKCDKKFKECLYGLCGRDKDRIKDIFLKSK